MENFVITMQTVTRKCSVRPQQSGHLQVSAKSLKLLMSSAIMTLNALWLIFVGMLLNRMLLVITKVAYHYFHKKTALILDGKVKVQLN